MEGIKLQGELKGLRIPQNVTGAHHLGAKDGSEQIPKKSFENVLAEAIERQKRISEDFDRLRARQPVRTDNLYGDGAFRWR